jgi:hypothetical protein
VRQIQGERLRNFEDARRALYGALVGDQIMFLVERGGEKAREHVLKLVERS